MGVHRNEKPNFEKKNILNSIINGGAQGLLYNTKNSTYLFFLSPAHTKASTDENMNK